LLDDPNYCLPSLVLGLEDVVSLTSSATLLDDPKYCIPSLVLGLVEVVSLTSSATLLDDPNCWPELLFIKDIPSDSLFRDSERVFNWPKNEIILTKHQSKMFSQYFFF
jgi:hypothetical protein